MMMTMMIRLSVNLLGRYCKFFLFCRHLKVYTLCNILYILSKGFYSIGQSDISLGLPCLNLFSHAIWEWKYLSSG